MAEQKFIKTVEGGEYKHELSIDDYFGEHEVTVHITMHEYRTLLETSALTNYKIKKAEDEAVSDRIKRQEVEKENAALKAEIYELRKRLDLATGGNESEVPENG